MYGFYNNVVEMRYSSTLKISSDREVILVKNWTYLI